MPHAFWIKFKTEVKGGTKMKISDKGIEFLIKEELVALENEINSMIM